MSTVDRIMALADAMRTADYPEKARAALEAAVRALAPQWQPINDGELWSWTRSVISQGADIRTDYDNGTHKGYEEYSARLDAAASERAQELAGRLTVPQWQPIETVPKDGSVMLYAHMIYCGKKRFGTLGEPQQHEFAWRCDSSGRFANPTHWMPLPAAPKEPT